MIINDLYSGMLVNSPLKNSHYCMKELISFQMMHTCTFIRLFMSRRYRLEDETSKDYDRLKEMFST